MEALNQLIAAGKQLVTAPAPASSIFPQDAESPVTPGQPPGAGISAETFQLTTLVGPLTQQLWRSPFSYRSVVIFNGSQKRLYVGANPSVQSVSATPLYIVPPYTMAVLQFGGDYLVYAGVDTATVSIPVGEIINVLVTADKLPPGLYKLPDGLGQSSLQLVDSTGAPLAGNGYLSVAANRFFMGYTTAGTAAGQVKTDTVTLDPRATALVILTPAATFVSRVTITGHQSGAVLSDFNPAPALSQLVCPLLESQDTSVDIAVTMGSHVGGGGFVSVSGLQGNTFIVPGNFGNAALSVTPASGSSLVATPGTSAANEVVPEALGTEHISTVLQALPSTIWGCTGFCEFITTDGLSIAAGQSVNILFIPWIRGTVSGKTLYFDATAVPFTQLSTATPAADLVAVAAFATRFTFPISSAVFFPGDTQFKFGVTFGNYSSFGGAHGVSISLGAALLGS